MPTTCCAFGCGSRSGRDHVSFFRLPKITSTTGQEDQNEKHRREAWLQAIGRSDLIGTKLKNARICSKHFITGKPSAIEFENDPDWIPSKFLRPKKIMTPNKNKVSPNTSKRKRFERVGERRRRNLLQSFVSQSSASTSTVTAVTEINISETVQLETNIETNLLEELQENDRNRLTEIQHLKHLKLVYEFHVESFINDDKKTLFYTGIPTFSVLQIIVQLLEPYLITTQYTALSPFQQIILTFMKLRLNLLFTDLGYRFNIDRKTASRYFYKCINLMFYKLKRFVRWPDRDEIRSTMPESFQKSFGDRVSVIIDCFEIFIERASSLESKVQTWSQYKHSYTIKYLIGICPQGHISFISKGYGGRCSDTFVSEDSGFLDHLLPGDLVLADRGFRIQDSAKIYLAEVATPAFLKGKKQLSPKEVESTRTIANVRIHVERVIGSLRQKYTILSEKLPILIINKKYTNESVTTVDKVVTVCCALTNLCPGIVSLLR